MLGDGFSEDLRNTPFAHGGFNDYQFVNTFTNEDVQRELLSTFTRRVGFSGAFLVSHHTETSNHQTTTGRNTSFPLVAHSRSPLRTDGDRNQNSADRHCRRTFLAARTTCVQTAIVNISAPVDGGNFLSWATRWLAGYHVDTLLVWAHLLSLSKCCGCSVVLSHPQPPLSGTRLLRVLTGTHRCDDPPKQGGGSPERQLVRCVVAWVCALALWQKQP